MNLEPRRLYRSRSERMISGVCGGIAQYLNMDPTLIRLLFVFAAIFNGFGVLAYIVMLFVVPEEPLAPKAVIPAEEKPAE